MNLLADPLYPRLKDYVIESTGLAYYADKDEDLADRLARRLAALGAGACDSYLAVLEDPQRGEAELDALLVHLTIGETYFFRHGEQFEALARIVFPDILKRNQASRRLRIWSAGCAIGAETYSVAMLLRDQWGDQLAGWDITILGTDVNREFLASAREGRFGEWALRGLSEELRARAFRQAGKSWLIAPEYKQWVSFQYHNLVKHPFPSLVNNLAACDLILCRNVMIYFDVDVILRMAKQFQECLNEGGWLVVGHAEPNTETFRNFRIVNAPGTTLYRKAGEAVPAPEAVSLPELRFVQPQPPHPVPPPPAATLDHVRQLADQGDWESAASCCREVLERDGLEPLVHFYHALVLEQLGQPGPAEWSLRRALYLDRRFVLAHYHLGLLLLRKKQSPAAARAFENVLELLAARDAAECLPDADGMTAADLRELAAMQLEVLNP
ncbi:MAG: protein-glutamate O-methyltransferase CheR [Acidobacteria bacterium]|nr:protein-glutamate O-methyltransferase CheR [Acidobacteriota bacterium]